MILSEGKNKAGQAIRLESEQKLNARGRVLEAHLRVIREEKEEGEEQVVEVVLWEGADTPDNAPAWQAALDEALNEAPTKQKTPKQRTSRGKK